MNRILFSCLFLIIASGIPALAQTLTIDSVTVDSVWNSDTTVNQKNQPRRTVKLSFRAETTDSVVFFVYLSLDSGKTWVSSGGLFDAAGSSVGVFKVAGDRRNSTVVRLSCGDTSKVVFRVEACTDPTPVSIVVDGGSYLAPIVSTQLGSNLGTWGADVVSQDVLGAVQKVGARLVRWPGGTSSDTYHWQHHSACSVTDYNTSPWTYKVVDTAWIPDNTFDNFMNHVIVPGGLEACITVDFGTNPACNGPGDPNEAAAWVAYVKAHNYNVHYWTVGNEQFGGWSDDLHPYNPAGGGTGKHWGTVYAASMAGDSGFYAKMKAADPTAQVGAVVEATGYDFWDGWDTAVVKHSPYDYVEFHWYAQQPGSESDAYLLNQAPADLATTIRTLRSELNQAGRPATPLMIGEFNSVSSAPGKQSMSIVNALFMGMAWGELFDNYVSIATMWFCYGGTQGCNNNNAASLYGWQSFGGYDAVGANTMYAWNTCTNNNAGPIVPEGSVFPAGNAAKLVSQFAVPGNHMVRVNVAASLPKVRAYAATQGSGYSLMLFNLDSAATTSVNVGIFRTAATSFTGTTVTYSKQQYDDSKNNVWTGPVSVSLGTVGTSSAVSLPPWSMTVLKLN